MGAFCLLAVGCAGGGSGSGAFKQVKLVLHPHLGARTHFMTTHEI